MNFKELKIGESVVAEKFTDQRFGMTGDVLKKLVLFIVPPSGHGEGISARGRGFSYGINYNDGKDHMIISGFPNKQDAVKAGLAAWQEAVSERWTK